MMEFKPRHLKGTSDEAPISMSMEKMLRNAENMR